MSISVVFPVEGQHMQYAERAAAWISASWLSIIVRIDDSCISLSTLDIEADRLRLIWRCALLNERLVSGDAERRARVLADLVA